MNRDGPILADNKVVGEAAAGGAISLSGTSTRAPALRLSQCVLSEREPGPAFVHSGPAFPGELTFERCVLPPWCSALDGDGIFAQAVYAMTDADPYMLTRSSPGVDEGIATAAGKDVLGRSRATPDVASCLGAYATPA